MAKQKLPISTGKRSVEATALKALISAAAIGLQNERVRKAMRDLSGQLVTGLRDWQARRAVPKLPARDRARVVNRFGQAGLASRARKLRAVVSGLRETPLLPPEARAAFGDFEKALDLIDLRLQVAAALPFGKRVRVLREIDDALDDLERILAEVGRV